MKSIRFQFILLFVLAGAVQMMAHIGPRNGNRPAGTTAEKQGGMPTRYYRNGYGHQQRSRQVENRG